MSRKKQEKKQGGGSDAALSCNRDPNGEIISVSRRGELLHNHGSRYYLPRTKAKEVVLTPKHLGLGLVIGVAPSDAGGKNVLLGVHGKFELALDLANNSTLAASVVWSAQVPVHCQECRENYYELRKILRSLGETMVEKGALTAIFPRWDDDVTAIGFGFRTSATRIRDVVVEADHIIAFISESVGKIATETNSMLEKKVMNSMKQVTVD